MPLLLPSYLLSQILAPFYASLLILSGVLFLGNLLPTLEVIITYDINLVDFLRLSVYLLPQLLLFAVPMAGLMGSILGFTRLATDREIMVLKASGIGLGRMLPPVLVFAAGSALLAALFSLTLIPAGSKALEQLFVRLAREKIDSGLQAQHFSESLGKVVLYADRIDKQNQRWHGVYVSDLRDDQVPITVIAKTGTIGTGETGATLELSLEDGSMHRTAGDTDQTFLFQRYHLSVPIAIPEAKTGIKVGKSAMTRPELLARAESLGTDTRNGADFLREYHKRLVLPVSCFLFCILGFPLGLLAGPGRRAAGIPAGIAAFLLYYVLLTGAEAMSDNLVLPVAAAMWAPNLCLALLTGFLFRAAARESFGPLFEKADLVLFRLGRFLPHRQPPSKGNR